MRNKITRARRPDTIVNPDIAGDHVAGAIYAALRPVDKAAVDMEAKWGVGRIVSLVAPDTASKFGSATERLNKAIKENDVSEVARRAAVMVRAYDALDREATQRGAKPIADTVKAWVAHDDRGEPFTVVQTIAEAKHLAERGVVGPIYHLEEIARVISWMNSRWDTVQSVKSTFPGAEITAIRKADNEPIGQDDIPF